MRQSLETKSKYLGYRFVPSPLQGEGQGGGRNVSMNTIEISTPIPTFPLQGGRSQKPAALKRLTVLFTPLRRSPNKPPALPGEI